MSPTVAATVLKFAWDHLNAKPKGRKPKSSGLLSMRNVGIVAVLAGALAYFKFDGIVALLLGTPIPIQSESTPPTTATGGAIRVYFTTPPGNPADPHDIAHACVAYIDQSKESIDVAGFEVDNVVITDALVRAAQRGVKVRLVTDTDYMTEYGPRTLRAAGVPVVDDQRSALMHHKFMVFDKKAVWTGSMNFTENCAYKNNNNGVFVAIPELAENYSTKFRWMFEQRKFGGKPVGESIPYPIIKLSDGTVIENYYSTHDQVASRLTGIVKEAKTSLDFLAFSFTHEEIGNTVVDRARAGVKVRGVFEKTQTAGGYSQYGKLASLGLQVFVDANPRNMHHKVMVVDGATTVTGSFNFSESADKTNDENVLIIRNNPAVAKQFEAETTRVFDAARLAAGGRP